MKLSLSSFALLGCFVALAACSSNADQREAVSTSTSHIEAPTDSTNGDDDDDDNTPDQADYVPPAPTPASDKGSENAACSTDDDCASGLVCAYGANAQGSDNPNPFCQPDKADVGDTCTQTSDCMKGLTCTPQTGGYPGSICE